MNLTDGLSNVKKICILARQILWKVILLDESLLLAW